MDKSNASKDSIGGFAVQCEKCFKWTLIPTKEEYETIRETFIEDPWRCEKRSNSTCDDPADIEYNTSRLWVIDKPNLPKPPPGITRMLMMRKDLSKLDANYLMPNGKRVRSSVEVEKFLHANPEYRGRFSGANFSFTIPKIMEDMVPRNNSSRSKKLKSSEDS
ncbi:methyl-CpG-binding domain-containing protein 4-like isoform X2 [Phalaenopsis equestris]|uniref:methyl-CpG-binding domain-containing protein 4-like isoform X2 n=1 Tax=Phalaenopsis equestris TaxID=78828 RepID=UPI0009E4F081|nr:methyl-CpG-binding domain-containing protein 4-like isoform X2 [Phalaenopsis equestris]